MSTMKLTTPKDKEFTRMEKYISLIEKELIKAPNGQNIYNISIMEALTEFEAGKIRDIYKEIGWMEVKWTFQTYHNSKNYYTKFQFTRK